MPTAATKYIKRVEIIRHNLDKRVAEILELYEKQIVDFIREKQLYEKGIDGKGRSLGNYSRYTIALKKLKGEIYDHITLLDEGDFYKDMTLFESQRKIIFWSTDVKTSELVKKYGEDIFTLTVENNKIVNEQIIYPDLVKWATKQLKIV